MFVTGALGMLGSAVVKELDRRGVEYTGVDINADESDSRIVKLDVTDESAVDDFFSSRSFDACIHTAAWTDVDAAEFPKNRGAAYKLNATASGCLARMTAKTNAVFIYVSTDYVFSGEGDEPYDPDGGVPDPVNRYGYTKRAGELEVSEALERHFIVRTSWLFGPGGTNFVDKMMKFFSEGKTPSVVNDQVGRPTYAPDLARLLVDMTESKKYGVYHATNSGDFVSWYEFAKEISRLSGRDVDVDPVSTKRFSSEEAAKRPQNSRMYTGKIEENGFAPLRDWRDALKEYLRKRI